MRIICQLGFLFLSCLIFSCGGDDAIPLNDHKKVTNFIINGTSAVIDETTISLNVLASTDVTNLVPIISTSTRATIQPTSGEAQDFTNPVTYTVTAEDGSTLNYIVTIVNSCASAQHVHPFSYDGKNYELIKLGRGWPSAAACAVERGGYLAEVNSNGENDAIFNEVIDHATFELGNTASSDGGDGSYVWIGGNDKAIEGMWIWDGDDDGIGPQFWEGDVNGMATNGAFTNWGNEPNDSASNQDGLALALTQWPIGSGSLGTPKQWNDIVRTNSLFFVIEFD